MKTAGKMILVIAGVALTLFMIAGLRIAFSRIDDATWFLDPFVNWLQNPLAAFIFGAPELAGLTALGIGTGAAYFGGGEAVNVGKNYVIGKAAGAVTSAKTTSETMLQTAKSDITNLFNDGLGKANEQISSLESRLTQTNEAWDARFKQFTEDTNNTISKQGEKILSVSKRAEDAESIVQTQAGEMTSLSDRNGILVKTVENTQKEGETNMRNMTNLFDNEKQQIIQAKDEAYNTLLRKYESLVTVKEQIVKDLERVTGLYTGDSKSVVQTT